MILTLINSKYQILFPLKHVMQSEIAAKIAPTAHTPSHPL